MNIEVGKTYRVMNDYRTRGNYNKGDILEITYIDKTEEYNRVDFLYNCSKSEFDSLEWIESMALEEVNGEQVDSANVMKIEVGKEYYYNGTIVGEMDGRFYSYSGPLTVVELFEDSELFLCKKPSGVLVKAEIEKVVRETSTSGLLDRIKSYKPAHYDTAIDTIGFAKANFSREQVEGFMRINAIKYLQRNKGEKLSDLRKCAAYVQMLIELEEDGIE